MPRLTTVLSLDEFPVKYDGFRYTDAAYWAIYSAGWSGAHSPDGVDYRMVARNFDLARRVDFGEIDEVLMHGAPYFGYWETNMQGDGSYWCNSGPTPRIPCSHMYVVLGFNYERGVAEMVHDDGHRAESIMSYVYGGWDAGLRRNLWERFTANYGQTPGTSWGIGSCHYPFNASSDYDYSNTRNVQSTARLWESMSAGNFPDLTNATTLLGRSAWGGTDYHRNYMKFFFSHMPYFAGRNQKDGLDRLNNWWEYVFNYNEHAESGGQFEPAYTPPPAPAFTERAQSVQLSVGVGDDWRPQINAANRVVWAGSDGMDMEIWSANANGTGLVQITSNAYADEMPRINSAGRIVWQGFDGKVFQIWSANADGTGVVQITNSPYHQWHPDISDNGRIVWEGFDGTDYEIYAANSDGAGLVQITSDTASYPDIPRDDLWPRINSTGRVAWMRYTGASWQIYSANSTGTNVVSVSNNAFDNEFPTISNGGRVAWHAWIGDDDTDVFVADSSGANAVRITQNNGTLDWWPQVNTAGDVVWMQKNILTHKWQVMRRSAAGVISAISGSTSHAQYPLIDDAGRLVWQQFDGSHWQIVAYANGVGTQLSTGAVHARAPAMVTGSEVVWHAESYIGTPGSPGYSGPTTDIFASVTTPPNAAPSVNVGPDLIVRLPAAATLAATVTDDGLPNPPAHVTLTWTDETGPGTVVFADPLAASTTATFSLPGTYTLALLAYDGALSSADTLQVTAYRPGDLNCSGTVGFDDINPFVLALTNPGGYGTTYPGCSILSGDINNDGQANFGDINPFVSLLTSD
jgi:hypothetical protein